MSDREYEDYLHGIYRKHYKDPVPYEVWSSLVSALPQPSHQLKYKDNLWDLSESYFKDHWLWSKVWVANEHISNPHRIQKGDSIHFDLKTLSAVNRKAHSVDIQKQFPNVKIPASPYQREALSEREFPSSLPNIKDRLDSSPLDAGFDLEPIPMDKTALLAFYLSEEDLSGGGVVESKDGYGQAALNGEDVIISYEGEMIEDGLYTIFENRGPPVFSFWSFLGQNFKGYEIAVKGSVKIIGYVEGTETFYRARVVESVGSINPGDRVMAGSIPGYILSQKGNPGSASGKIIGSPHRRQRYFGMYAFVYLDKGLSNGVQVGDIYHVKLNKDTEIQYPYLYDKPAVGKVRVVHANPDTATAIIVGLRDTIKVGDFFEPGSGVSAVTGPMKDHEEIDGDLDDGEGGMEDMEAGGSAKEEAERSDDDEEGIDEGMEPVDEEIDEAEETEGMETGDIEGAKESDEGMGLEESETEDSTEVEEMEDTEEEIEDSAGEEASDNEGDENTASEEPDAFSEEELNKKEAERKRKKERKPPENEDSPSPVPSEVKEEFDELKDM